MNERCNCDASCGENRYHDLGTPGCRWEAREKFYALRKLNDGEKVLMRHLVEYGLTHRRMADIFKLPVKTISIRLASAKRKLK